MSIPIGCTAGPSLFNSTMAPPEHSRPAELTRTSHIIAAEQPQLRRQSNKRRADKPLQPYRSLARRLGLGTIIWFSIVHAGALAAPFFFTWKAVGLFVVMYWLTGGLGIYLGYHRLLTHGSFQTYRPVKWFFAFLGGLAGEGSAVIWVANHRKHHAHSE